MEISINLCGKQHTRVMHEKKISDYNYMQQPDFCTIRKTGLKSNKMQPIWHSLHSEKTINAAPNFPIIVSKLLSCWVLNKTKLADHDSAMHQQYILA